MAIHEWYAACEDAVLSGFGKSADVLRDRLALILSVAAAYLFMIDGGTRIVRGILDKFSGLYWKVLKVLNEEGQ